ncbi:MAG: DUF1080 domain-containing protein [Flammeovirgaceae bacterium]|nr:DUF1080 domain-containing protein [Flammeovirgaceae bacterium]
MNFNKYLIITALISFTLFGCQPKQAKEAPETIVEEATEPVSENKGEWISLFDGKTAKGWRGYNQSTLPEAWVVEDGTLKSLGKGGDIGGDIVFGDMEFEDFELQLEWKISEGGNSGVFYHVQEGDQYHAPYENAPEYQLIDDIGFPQKLEEWQSLGADYAMYPADKEKKIVKKAGEWNSSRIIFQKENAEYWLNGEKVVSFVPWSEDWQKRRDSGKWKDMPDYGKAKKGLIGLQDHGSFILFRNIKVRHL